MNLFSTSFTVVALVFLTLCCVANGANPHETCLYSGTDDPVCRNCVEFSRCRGGQLSEVIENCPDDEICVKGGCIEGNSGDNPICFCAEGEDCNVNPYDAGGFVRCTAGTNQPATVMDPFLESQDLDFETCSFQNITCPECGYIATEGEDCTSYTYCVDGASDVSSCPPNFCFFDTSCSCTPYSGCPDCGFIADATDCNVYYYCNDDDSLEFSKCPLNFCFDNDICSCIPAP